MKRYAGFTAAAAIAAAVTIITPGRGFAQTFALDPASISLVAIPATSGDLLTPSGVMPPSAAPPPVVGWTAADLGLLPGDVIDAISYGDEGPFGAGPLQFSVSRTAAGAPIAPGDVSFEQTTHPAPEASSDMFSALDPACPLGPGANTQITDGDGLATAGFCYAGYGLGLSEIPPPGSVDNISAFDWGYPGTAVFTAIGFSLAPGSPTLAGANPLLPGGGTPADLLVTSPGTGAPIFVFAPAAMLGLVGGPPGCTPPVCDDMDALAVSFPGGATVAFSVSPGSPSLGLCGYSPGDVLGGMATPIPACSPAAITAATLGLVPGDNLDALESTTNGCPEVPPGSGFDAPDEDGIGGCDNCLGTFNPGQEDFDGDGPGDACDPCTDTDADGFGNPGFPSACATDLCPFTPGPNGDADGDTVGDICDNCAALANADQANTDFDAFGDACDLCPTTPGPNTDTDGDLDGDICDNCPLVANPDQANFDGDSDGDLCDSCPHVAAAVPSPFDAGTLKKASLGFKNNGPGTGDDSAKTGASFTTGVIFDPDSTDSAYVTISNTTTSAVLGSAAMPAGAPWTQPNPAKLAWKYQTAVAPIVKASIKESPAASTTYKWKVGVKSASLPGPQITPATDDMRVTLEITPAGLCFSGTLGTCTSTALKKDSCKLP